MYYKFAEDAGVGSSLMDSKDKGEGEGRVTFLRTLVVQTLYTTVTDLFLCFWRTKISLVGRNDLGGTREVKKLKSLDFMETKTRSKTLLS